MFSEMPTRPEDWPIEPLIRTKADEVWFRKFLGRWNQLLAEAPPLMSNKERATWVQETYASRYG